MTAEEIGAAIGRSAATVIKFAAARTRSPATVRRAVALTAKAEAALRRMAADYDGVSAAEALEDLINFALADDAVVARRTLRVVRKKASAPASSS